MDYNIILNALRESIDYIKKLDDIRGELNENLEPINTFENVSFKNDFQDADMFLNNIYLPLKIFEIGFNEFMSSENTAKFEKKYLLSQILIISRSCDNLHPSLYNDEIISLNYFDEKTGFDEDWREIHGELVWCIPDLEDYKNAFPDNRVLHIYYKYSYYIISIAKIISEVVNNYLELTNSRYIYYYLSERRTKFHFMSLKHFNPIEAMYISDIFNEYHDYIRNGNVSYERSYSFGNFFLKYLNYEKLEDENNINENLDAIPFKDSQFEEYYNKIVEIFGLDKVFKDENEKKNYFNLLEFKFKVYNEEGVGIYNLEQAYEICKDLSLILGKANAIKVFESCYQLNPNSQVALSDSNFNLTQDANMKEKEETITQSNTSLQSDLCVGCYDAKRTRELYDECCDNVFEYCKLEDFVNSLNNPEECNLIVKYQSRLYVLYKFFDDIFGCNYKEKIEKLNEKFGITERRYGQKKFRYGSTNTTTKQKEFYDILVEI